jgi:16S rRNA G966 N2-methylase RsmD
VFLERSRAAVEAIRENLHTLGIEDRASVVVGKVLASLGRQTADIVFLDPPYRAALSAVRSGGYAWDAAAGADTQAGG